MILEPNWNLEPSKFLSSIPVPHYWNLLKSRSVKGFQLLVPLSSHVEPAAFTKIPPSSRRTPSDFNR